MLRKRSQAASIERALVFGVRSNCDAPRPAEQDACPRLPRDVLRLQPDKLRAFSLMQSKVLAALKGANRETGGSVLELGEAEYMVRASGYLKTLDDFRQIPPATSDTGIAVRLPVNRAILRQLDGKFGSPAFHWGNPMPSATPAGAHPVAWSPRLVPDWRTVIRTQNLPMKLW
jgi:hypothetical protein